ncbi:helix-turn-helix transcriptional regulator [Saccharicrinis aurantiacus]|uniref:helix-turn-helix transcriptional regulator n=1 Tax=Saccharicrinis aurantiacus TaxID=1849719 RepID=UPI0021D163A5|nr:helix-turn-helix transcriptional regulator [Saccharicrinis aurantiacus]
MNEVHFKQLIQLANKNLWLTKLLTIVVEKLGSESLYAEYLAQNIFMSSSKLNRKLVTSLGITTMTLVRNLRLQYAAELIAIQNKSISDAAFLSGFFDASHLSRHFTKAFDCTAGEFNDEIYCYVSELKHELLSQIAK